MKLSKYDIGEFVGVILIIVAFITCITFCVFSIFNHKDSILVHVHFIDSNECYDVKHVSSYNGIVMITFDDESVVKVGANNVVVYVDHVCDYCGK